MAGTFHPEVWDVVLHPKELQAGTDVL